MIRLLDHTEPNWSGRYTQKYAAKGRENGAATYSRELTAFQVPIISELAEHAGLNVIVSTCPVFHQVHPHSIAAPPEKYDLAVQYLHTYRYDNPLFQPMLIKQASGVFAKRTLFITAYKQLYLELSRGGFDAIFVPMSIDTRQVRGTVAGVTAKHREYRAIYFGNITHAKQAAFEQLRTAFINSGWQLDCISDNHFNGAEPLTRGQAWRRIAEYTYGVGVGRCALEMMAMDKKTMISGAHFGGIMTDELEWRAQLNSNLNSRIITFNRDIPTCIRLFDNSYVRTQDSKESAAVLRRELERWLA